MSGKLTRPLLLASVFLFVTCAAAGGAVPDPGQSTVPNVVYDPDGLLPYGVVVRDSTGTPVAGAVVEIVFSTAADAMICWCPGQAHPTISTTTNAQGVATFTILAGGCVDPAFVTDPVEVFADAISLGVVGGVSTDAVDNNGLHPWEGWNPAGSCLTGLSDAVVHSVPIKIRDYEFCTDLDSDGRVSLIDAVLITKPIKTAAVCPP